MGRKRIGTVIESEEELRRLLDVHRESTVEPRLRFLLALRDQPGAKSEVLTGIVGHSERTIRRWWKTYRDGGLSVLLDRPTGAVGVAESSPLYRDHELSSLTKLLNAVPITSDVEDWRRKVELALGEYIGATCLIRLSQFPSPGTVSMPSSLTVSVCDVAGDQVGEVIIAARSNQQKPNRDAAERIAELQPFLAFLFTDIVARNRSAASFERLKGESLVTAPFVASLSIRERDVLACRLQGSTYAETALLLSISEETVRKYVKTIYRKTGTSSIAELFLRYFTALGNANSKITPDDA